MRRFLSATLAILVLLLSGLTCSDAHEPAPAGTSAAIEKAPPDDCGSDMDCCSPFCTCACCAGFTIPTAVFAPPCIPITGSSKVFCVPRGGTLPEIAIPVWQPPQLA